MKKPNLKKILAGYVMPLAMAGGMYLATPNYAHAGESYLSGNSNPIVQGLDKLSKTGFGKIIEHQRKKIIDDWAVKQGTGGKTLNDLQNDVEEARKKMLESFKDDSKNGSEEWFTEEEEEFRDIPDASQTEVPKKIPSKLKRGLNLIKEIDKTKLRFNTIMEINDSDSSTLTCETHLIEIHGTRVRCLAKNGEIFGYTIYEEGEGLWQGEYFPDYHIIDRNRDGTPETVCKIGNLKLPKWLRKLEIPKKLKNEDKESRLSRAQSLINKLDGQEPLDSGRSWLSIGTEEIFYGTEFFNYGSLPTPIVRLTKKGEIFGYRILKRDESFWKEMYETDYYVVDKDGDGKFETTLKELKTFPSWIKD